MIRSRDAIDAVVIIVLTIAKFASTLLVGQGENPLTFPIGLVLNDQLFGLRILASRRLELQRMYLTDKNNRFMFDILNQGLWDQDVMDSPSDATSRGIQYSAVMGEQLWRLISRNTLQVGEPKYPFDRNF